MVFGATGNANPNCLDHVKQLELKRGDVALNWGMWGYFERSDYLKKKSVIAMQLDSRINKILFLLSHLCETQSGIPLNSLATYLLQNFAEKGEDKFKDELLYMW